MAALSATTIRDTCVGTTPYNVLDRLIDTDQKRGNVV